MSASTFPQGFYSYVTNAGIKNTAQDFVCVYTPHPCTSAAVFTQSLFAGCSVDISRQHAKKQAFQCVLTISKNANVATGEQGYQDAQTIITSLCEQLALAPHQILLASTGIIGQPYPMDKIRAVLPQVKAGLQSANAEQIARGIMTTDTTAKHHRVRVGNATVVGVAKGVGMIEPNMATLLAFFFTDAAIDASTLDQLFRRVMDKTFNCLSIDTDTSTSDTAGILANGLAGEVDLEAFENALFDCALHLVKAIAQDGEGATKLMEVRVQSARDVKQAKTVAKSIANSPLVKAAVHGEDPNWGRILMAIGKCSEETDIKPERVQVFIGDIEVFPQALTPDLISAVRHHLAQTEVVMRVILGTGIEQACVWGCDLSPEYVVFNSAYST